MSVLFSLRFLHRFLVAFWSDFGVILGGFGRSKSVILAIDFEHRFLIVFWFDFGVILGGFWGDLGGRNRSFLASVFSLFLNVLPCVHVCLFGRLKVCVCVAPGPSKRGQERPKAAQEGAKLSQKWPKSGQKRSIRSIFEQISFNKIKRKDT